MPHLARWFLSLALFGMDLALLNDRQFFSECGFTSGLSEATDSVALKCFGSFYVKDKSNVHIPSF